MDAHELFRAGKLPEAIEAMNAEVRANPADPDRRAFLADLLCLAGNFERADVQLDAISKVLPGAMQSIILVRQLIRAETWRQECFGQGRAPEFLAAPEPLVQNQLQALMLMREGDDAAAGELARSTEEQRAPLPGRCDGVDFEDFRDGDDICAGVFEVLTSTGKYFWVPMTAVERLELRPVERPRDLKWRRAGMEVRGGPDGEVYLPNIYAPHPEDSAARLGRSTEWTETEPVRGIGLRTFLVGEEARTILEFQTLEFQSGEFSGG
jgi:type VI secretion system protein ImpE